VGKHLNTRLFAAALLLGVAVALAPASRLAAQARDGVGSDPIRPGDVVRLSVMSDRDLSGDYPVNQFGTVVLPVVGEYDVSSETQRSLRDKVIKDLRELRSAPDVEVVVLRRVRVLGEVNEPGVYPLDPTMTIADAVAMARGRTQFASEGKVLLRRGADVIDADLRLDLPLSESPVRSGDEIFVPRRGWMDRNLGIVVAAASTAVTVLVTLLLADGSGS
jgi:protein involved in polysaccharide export with SLBB domain